jgi:CxxC motif-containing protein
VTVTLADDGTITSVTGNSCMRGDKYARDEVTHPVRVVTTTVPVVGSATEKMVSVKTAGDVPKGRVFDVVRALADVTATAPVHIGDVILADVAGTGVDIVATKDA